MKKKPRRIFYMRPERLLNVLLMTKFILFLVIVSSFQSFSKGYGQSKINVSLQNASLKNAFKEIEKKSDYHFLYNDDNVINTKKRITVDINNGSIDGVLDVLLNQTDLKYQLSDNNTVIIYNKGTNVQAIAIKGKVTDETDKGLPGVTVKVKGANIGTQTDIDGNYTLSIPDENVTLTFTYIGYDPQETIATGRTIINIKLKASTSSLNEVVVVGYGAQKKATLTGAVEQVSSKVFESRAVTNPALALQGETPGLVVTRTSSRPGNEGIALQIRGATSVNGGSPLIVIDGIPAATNNSFLTMNPDDIESVSVLKDGMAAIYGSRAANGVILVTTKRGKGDMRLDYNANVRFNTVGIRTPSPTMQQYATMWINADKEESVPDYWGWNSLANLQKMQQGIEGIYTTKYWGDIFLGQANRFDELFASRLSQQHNLGISGSSDKTNYRLSLGYADNQGNLATSYDGQKQYNIRLNYDYKVTNWFKLQTGVTYQKDLTSGPSSGLGFELIAEDPPFFPAKNPYGEWYANFGNAGNRNSVASTTDGGRNIFGNELTRVDLKADFQLMKDLELEGTGSISSNQYRLDLYNLTVPQYEWDGTLAPSALNPTSNIRAESDNTFYQNYGAYLHYNKSFGDHHITALAGINAEKNDFKGLYAYRTNISNNGVYDLNVASTSAVEGTGGQNHYGFYSYLSRINYSYQDKYLVEALGRRDGSSRFAPGYQFSNFYNVSAGWVATNEDFIKNLDLKALNFLKVRASYGVTGNQAGIGLYDYISTVSTPNVIFGSTPANQQAAYLTALTSNTRTWERVNMRNIGIDLGFLKNRLTGTFDYYKKQNNGMLINITYPTVLGGAAPTSNSGVLNVHGWEATVAWKDKVGQVNYNLGFNIGDSRNILSSMQGKTAFNAGKVGTIVGYPLNSWFMYQTDGYFKNQADVDAYYAKYTAIKQGELPSQTDGTQNLRPGDVKKVDLDGNGYISAVGDPSKGDKGDVKYMGDAAPHYIFGINMGASYKGFDFSAFFQGVGKQLLERDGTLEYPFTAVYVNPNVAFLGKTWTADNTGAQFPRLTVNPTRAGYDYLHNDFMLQNNRYIRLKSLIVGYTLPKEWLRKAKIQRVRIYFSGNDLFEFTSIKDGFDPEQGSTSQNDGYPFMRTWAFGVNVGF